MATKIISNKTPEIIAEKLMSWHTDNDNSDVDEMLLNAATCLREQSELIEQLEESLAISEGASHLRGKHRDELLVERKEIEAFQSRLQADADMAEGRLDDIQQERQEYADELQAILNKNPT